jgi:hypothetical protein
MPGPREGQSPPEHAIDDTVAIPPFGLARPKAGVTEGVTVNDVPAAELPKRHAAAAFLAAGLVFAVLAAAGCSRQPGAPRASVESCIRFGVAAIRHHVTVTSLPPACQGLTSAQIDFAVGSALHSAAIGARGKAAQRERIGQASHYLERMAVTSPPQRTQPQVPSPPARPISSTALGLIALCTWLITVALGLRMMARWILRGRARRVPRGRSPRRPVLNFAHLGLAGASLLTWIAYLATGVTGLAWTACAILTLVTGLGMTLVFVPFSAGPGDSAAAGDAAQSAPARGRRPPVFTLGAHIIFATVTILLAFLTAIGTG